MLDFTPLASGSTGNAYILDDGQSRLLLEAGLPIKTLRRKTGFGLGRMEGCLVSHEHLDHAKAVRDVLRAGVDVYASQGTIEALGMRHHRLHPVRHNQEFQVGPWRVVPFNVIHDAAEPLGFLVGSRDGDKLLFATDTQYLPHQFRGLTCIAIEANFDGEILKQNVSSGAVHPDVGKRLWGRHMSLQEVKRFLAAADLSRTREIHLLHLSDANANAKDMQRGIERQTGIPTFVA